MREPLEKFLAPVARFRDEPLAVRAFHVLEPGPEITVGKAPSQAALELLCRHTYRRRFLPGSGQRMMHFRTVAHMANRLPVFRVTRPAYPFLIDALADRVELGREERTIAAFRGTIAAFRGTIAAFAVERA